MDQLCEQAGLLIVLVSWMGPEGDGSRAPNQEAALYLLEEAHCLQLEFQSGNNAIIGFCFFFSSHHFNVLRTQNSFDLESPLRTRANVQPQFEKTFSITARLDQLSFPKSTNPRSMWVRFLVHFSQGILTLR